MEILNILLGFILRLALPLGITLLVVAYLKRLDDHWRAENLREAMGISAVPGSILALHCWDVHDCSMERRANCRAYKHPGQPCWEAFRSSGQLQESCSVCDFRIARLAAAAF